MCVRRWNYVMLIHRAVSRFTSLRVYHECFIKTQINQGFNNGSWFSEGVAVFYH